MLLKTLKKNYFLDLSFENSTSIKTAASALPPPVRKISWQNITAGVTDSNIATPAATFILCRR
jgi:hypothetical protein